MMTRFFKISLLLASLTAFTGLSGNTFDDRTLKFYHTHTGKALEVAYYRQGEYDPEALARIRMFLASLRETADVVDRRRRIEEIQRELAENGPLLPGGSF